MTLIYLSLYTFAPVRIWVGVCMHEYLCVSISLQESQEINVLTSRSRRNIGFLWSSAPSLPLLLSQKWKLREKEGLTPRTVSCRDCRNPDMFLGSRSLVTWRPPSPGSTAASSLLSLMDETDWTSHPLSPKGVGEEQELLRCVV